MCDAVVVRGCISCTWRGYDCYLYSWDHCLIYLLLSANRFTLKSLVAMALGEKESYSIALLSSID